ncbi:MAG: formyltransferase [Betaproteobacteria bacterium]
MSSAVVFGYHNVGVRCLRVLLARGVRVALVVTHPDNPGENIWFGSVAAVAAEHRIPCITPDDPNAPEIVARIAALQPDFLFSFYYRSMLKAQLLALPRLGALNMHGSLLPKYRGRVPVNWAIIHGETDTGATLHYMTEKPDNGDIVAQTRVPILPDDTAGEVFEKVSVAAELTLFDALPALIAGNAPRVRQDLSQGGYFGGRRPDDGRIDWTQPAARVHNLVRALAPPYPGAFTDLPDGRLVIARTRLENIDGGNNRRPSARLRCADGRLYADCVAGTLEILSATLDGRPLAAAGFEQRFGLSISLVDDR